jgi:hypothetical protein
MKKNTGHPKMGVRIVETKERPITFSLIFVDV